MSDNGDREEAKTVENVQSLEDVSQLTRNEMLLIEEVGYLQSAIRCFLARKTVAEEATKLVSLEWVDEPEEVSIAQEHYEYSQLPLSELAAEMQARLPSFLYSLRVMGGEPRDPVLLSDGSVYIGQWKDGKRYGKGKCYTGTGALMEGYWSNGLHLKGRVIYPNGDLYEGDFVHMRKEGKGRFENGKGDVSYDGEWLNNLKHGFGVEQLADGSRYEGLFSDDAKNGRGKFVWKCGDVYEGDFKNNMIHGQGKFVWNAVKLYEGEWFEGSMHGKGHLVRERKDYIGEFVKDKKQGHGVLKWEENVYEGDFFDNKMHGKGLLSQKGNPTMLYAFERNKRGALIEDSTNEEAKNIESPSAMEYEFYQRYLSYVVREKRAKLPPFPYSTLVEDWETQKSANISNEYFYNGQWKDEKRHGRGVCYMSNGEFLEGYWSNGLFIKGRVIYTNGDMYEGEFENSQREGRGRWENAEGNKWYDGEWLANMKHGIGMEQMDDGSRYEGNFKNNKIHGQGKCVWNAEKWYEGEWFEGSMHGKGHLVQEGKDYIGEFVKDKKQGHGVLKWEWNVYEGDFFENKMHGKGLFSQKGKPAKLYVFEKNKRGALIEDPPAS